MCHRRDARPARRGGRGARQLTESQRWWDLGAEILCGLGVPDAERRSRWLLACVDRLLADQLARPQAGFEASAAVRAALRGILEP